MTRPEVRAGRSTGAAIATAALAAVVLLSGSGQAPADAASTGDGVIWTGSGGSAWSHASSWSSGAAPTDGDALIFPAAPANGSVTVDDLPRIALTGIALDGAWSVEPSNGANVTLTGPMTSDMSGQTPPGEGHEVLWQIATVLAAPTQITNTYGAGILTLRAPITGGANVSVRGPGQVLWQGAANLGTLTVDGASAGRTDFGDPRAVAVRAVVEAGAALGFGNGTYSLPIEVAGAGTRPTEIASSWAPGALRVQTNGQNVSPILSGPITLAGPATFATSGVEPQSSLTFTGALTGPHPLTLTGQGEVRLSGPVSLNALVSQTRLLTIDGSVNAPVTVNETSTLSGHGSLSALDLHGTLRVEAGPADSTPLTVTGPTTLAGALQLDIASVAPVGTDVTLLRATDPVAGTFTGHPEGDVFTAGGATWRITYRGGDGNDVVVRRLAAASMTAVDTQATGSATSPARARLTVRNAGPDEAEATVTLPIPAGMTAGPLPAGCSAATQIIRCPVRVPADGERILTLVLHVGGVDPGDYLLPWTVEPAGDTATGPAAPITGTVSLRVLPGGAPPGNGGPDLTPNPAVPPGQSQNTPPGQGPGVPENVQPGLVPQAGPSGPLPVTGTTPGGALLAVVAVALGTLSITIAIALRRRMSR